MLEEKREIGEISRRQFLKDAGLAVGGAAIGSTVLLTTYGPEVVTKRVIEKVTKFVCPSCSQEFTSLSALQSHVEAEHPAEVVEVPKAKGHIVQISYDISACVSCGTCEIACATVHEGAASNSLRRIWLDRQPFDGVYFVKTCQQCDYPECYFACPLKDEVLCIDSVTGARYINPDKCLGAGCKFCIEACPFDSPRINFDAESNVAVKCDLCKDRTEGPACVEFCTQQALTLA